MSQPRVICTCREMHSYVEGVRARGKTVGLVPTMGALHAGHMSLVRASQAECDETVATIFVNPTQFAPHEDLNKYPRTFSADLEKLAEHGVAAVFAPTNEEVYPVDFSTYVEPPEVSRSLEGDCRPGHFRGVATIVLKLFNVAPADVAFFGQKDFQQSLVIRHMVTDLNVPITIRVCPIVRESDGLAMSSRNVYLSSEERGRALALSRALNVAKGMVDQGERNISKLETAMRDELLTGGVTTIEYACVVDAESLASLAAVDGTAVALIAARVGSTRLIDNCLLT
ncbi:MAG: pantoate--beta-alanine ligase [Planctomycetales bacterium]|nr:pantoate--beta-alanine ligase [Planctomycetales bacterium]